MLPVTGPFRFVQELRGPPNKFGFRPKWYSTDRTWRRQKPPYNLELPFKVARHDILWVKDPTEGTISYYEVGFPASFDRNRLYAAALAGFRNEVRGVSAQLGATLGEHKQALAMIAQRAKQLYAGFKAVSRFDLRGLKRAWGRHAGWRNRSRAAGGHILEYSFGWAPLVADIAAALEVLYRIPPSPRVTKKTTVVRSGDLPEVNYGSSVLKPKYNQVSSIEFRANVRVTNPNLLLAENLGLVNLASIAWELTPFSFILDYFVNVQDFLGNLTGWMGLELERSAWTFFEKTHYDGSNYFYTKQYGGYQHPKAHKAQRVIVDRSVPITDLNVSLSFKTPWNLQPARAATSIALLLQLL